MHAASDSGINIAIDRGGTFTDVWASFPGKGDVIFKLLSVDPDNYQDAPIEGIRRVLSMHSGEELPRGQPLPKEHLHSIRMGTTVATNALLERKGTRHAFLVNKGLRDLLIIGNQSRPRLFDLNIVKPDVLFDEVVEIDERITVEGFDEDVDGTSKDLEEIPGELVRGISGDMLRILEPLNEDTTRASLEKLRADGFTTLAVCLAHSYIYPYHEQRIAEIASEMGFSHISLSSAVGANMIKMVPRGSSASADAYLTPETKKYIEGFCKGFEGGNLDGLRCEFMQSDGGLIGYKGFGGLRGILSGPAGGVVGYARTSYDGKTPVVGFDMGGTSTDVSRYGGAFEHVFETTTAGVTIQSPQLDINTVAAGGGSILSWHNGLFKVGPESASAHPGPASYRKGGPLTVTDANLFLGRLLPEYFPKIFGPNEDQPLDGNIVTWKFSELTKVISADIGREMTSEEVANGFIEVANEAMCRPIRALTEARGHETAAHNLGVFGGAGGQHACEIACNLGISRVILHKYSSILSAYGMALAEVVQEVQEPSSEELIAESMSRLRNRLANLKETAAKELLAQGVSEQSTTFEVYLNLRYQGTDTALMIPEPKSGDFKAAFLEEHLREFAFVFPDDRKILVDDIRIRGVGKSGENAKDNESLAAELGSMQFKTVDETASKETRSVFFKSTGRCDTPVYVLDNLPPGSKVEGPAMIIDKTQTIVVVPGAEARVLTSHVIIDLEVSATKVAASATTVDPVQLSVFGHRFMSIAEQMGRTLQRTSCSLNIKERLDFSCAVFGPDGGLVANAPHVPVHLGSMSYAVKYQHELLKGKLSPGDVLVSNHPESGGTHLPDITVITPVFESTGKEIAFYVASRGHHTDIGGLGGTSMPPNSTQLWQEGAAIRSFRLIHNGEFDEVGIVNILLSPGNYEGCNGSRRINDNLSDLKAQVAANNKGMILIQRLMEEFGREVVQLYMNAIQANAEIAVRGYLLRTREKFGSTVLRGEDYMDSGSIAKLVVNIKPDGSAVFDFTGTSCEMYGNMNAPPAITYSAIIYCLRLLIGTDIPLNQGCLAPIEVILPKGSFLNPTAGAAVCAGNTQTSQRVCDLILKTFQAAAASQGCMNCLGFFGEGGVDKDGNKLSGHAYAFGETIAGGSGAGPSWHGASGVHTHMTNTRISDPELLEKKYPVLMREFSIRKGSGGRGLFNGGDGVIRDYQCRAPLKFSVITERRVHRPYGLNGGEEGQCGANYWVTRNDDGSERWINLGPKNMVSMQPGDRCVIHTPSGGGWGDVPKSGANGLNGATASGATTARETYPRASGSLAAYTTTQAEAA
ncbi:hypothetical protein YB2330_004663 [Saitoella coloradoensis]